MLFKRKGGNNSPKGQQRVRSDKDAPRAEQNGSGPPAPSRPATPNWDEEARQEMSSLFNKTGVPDSLEGTRRAVAQRRASRKMASIDWDVAAKEEITALFGAKEETGNKPGGSDSELESVRRAIAARKAKGPVIPPVSEEPRIENAQPTVPVNAELDGFSIDDEDEDRGPRLDWLVDFISDDDKNNDAPTVASVSSRTEPGTEPEIKKDPAIKTGSGFGPDDIELVLRAQETPPDGLHLDADAIMGDGFGNVNRTEESGGTTTPAGPSEEDNTPFFGEIVDDTFQAPPPEVKPPPVPKDTFRPVDKPRPKEIVPREEKPAPPVKAKQAEKDLPAAGRSLDIDSLRTKDRVVGILLKKQIVTMGQVFEAQKIKEREASRETLWRILVGMDKVNSDAIFEEAARIYAFPVADTEGKLDAKFVRSVMETLSDENKSLLLNLHLVPFECEAEQQSGAVKLVFITHDPMRTEVRKVMKELKLDRFDLYYAPKVAVDTLIAEAFPRKNEFLDRMNDDPMAFDLGMSYEEADIFDEDALEAEISRSSLINLFEATLVESVRLGASDVHIYPNAKKRVEIHFRVDGRLMLWHTEHKVHPEALLAVIKDNAMNVDRFERDAAQDGYIQRWIDDVLIRFRVSVLPIANVSHEIRSESIVIRVLDDRKVIRDLRKLGLLEEAMVKFEQAITQPHGMVILTGPTGSGKSTSLVAALHPVITGEVNVLTVEDPVEYIIPGVRQIKLNYKLELEDALRAILRHDPDIVMVGEMRDRKTAELAIKLANTGHLTFSTLHTNDAPSAISRLYKMGIEPFLIAYAINLIVAQRLIRKLCSTCKQPDLDPDPIMLEKLGFTREEVANITFYLPGKDDSCPECKGVGYKGRRAICEALYFSREIRHLIVEADKMIDEGTIKDQAVKEGMLTLRDAAREIVKLGETSVREMIRVVTTE